MNDPEIPTVNAAARPLPALNNHAPNNPAPNSHGSRSRACDPPAQGGLPSIRVGTGIRTPRALRGEWLGRQRAGEAHG